MAWIATGMVVSGGINYMASKSASKNQLRAQRETNDANARMAQMANEMEMERYFQSRGAAMGATYEELTTRPTRKATQEDIDNGKAGAIGEEIENEEYDPELSMFSEDGSSKTSAVLPLYLSDMEREMGANIEDKYQGISEAYDGVGEFNRVQELRQGMAGAEQGMVDTVNNVYSGQELSNTNAYLDDILNTRTQGVNSVKAAQLDGLAGKNAARTLGNTAVASSRLTGASEIGLARTDGTDGVASARLDGSQNLGAVRLVGENMVGNARNTGANLNTTARMMGLGEVQDARDSISQAQAQAILNEGQRNAARADFTGRTGIVGNSGNAQAQTLAALMNAYTNAGVNAGNNRLLNAQDASDVYLANAQDIGQAGIDNASGMRDALNLNAQDYRTDLVSNASDRKADSVANAQGLDLARVANAEDLRTEYMDSAIDKNAIDVGAAKDLAKVSEQGALEKFAAYEQNLKNKKDFSQVGSALNNIANNSTAGMGNVYAPENATSSALGNAGMKIGLGAMPEANVPAYTAPVKTSGWEHAGAAIQGGLSGAMLANGLAGSFGGGRPTTIGADVTGGAPSHYIPGTDQYTI
jgi:hypothetical protein